MPLPDERLRSLPGPDSVPIQSPVLEVHSPADIRPEMPRVVTPHSPIPIGASPEKHRKYYFNDNTVVLLVENVLFRVHRHFLERESGIFRVMFTIPQDGEQILEGSDDEHPIVIPSCRSKDFANLLWVFYNDTYNYETTAENWKSILSCSDQFDMQNISALAIQKLQDKLQPLEKIKMCLHYDIDRVWALDAFLKLSSRKEQITKEESGSLDMDSLLVISAARQKLSGSSFEEPQKRTVVEKEMKTYFGSVYDRTAPRRLHKVARVQTPSG